MAQAQGESVVRDPDQLFAKPDLEIVPLPDGARILRSRKPSPSYPSSVNGWLVDWAARAPQRDFLCEREGNEAGAPWLRLTYGEALQKARAVAGWLLAHGVSAERPVAVLSDNSIDHALIVLGASLAGVPVASISVAYSLMSKDHAKLKSIIRQLTPGAIYLSDAAMFGGALAALDGLHDARLVASRNASGAIVSFDDVLRGGDNSAVNAAMDAVGLDTVAKILFTSGSTGEPKGVINTQRMLTYGQESKVAGWRFLDATPVITLDWLPWSHTFGANHNFNLILRGGGTMYIDNGKPAPGLIQRTLANIRDVSSSVMFNVPRGYDLLLPELRKDDELRKAFFRNLRIVFYAGAALPQHVWDEIDSMARETVGEAVVMTTGWGSTETAPLASDCHFQAERSGNIGVPPPGGELKLVPNGGKDEIRVRGPMITPGYWRRPDLTAAAFDEDGFYKIGDAVRLADPGDPNRGLYFDGRVSEDFKLTSGTWVNVGGLRVKAIEALAPLAQDIVVAGHDRADIGLLVFANLPGCRAIAGLGEDATPEDIVGHEQVRVHLRESMMKLKHEGGGSSMFAPRALLMAEPPSVDAGEITDKGYINQRAVLTRRAALVEQLYSGSGATVTI